jgi:predicted nuclease of predicted toxin-antitoxin system
VTVRLLFDENISPRLVTLLASLYPGSLHVSTAGFTSASDLDMWSFAAANELVIVTKDHDFQEFSLDMGHPPKVIAVATGNCSTRRIKDILRTQAIRINHFGEDETRALLLLA